MLTKTEQLQILNNFFKSGTLPSKYKKRVEPPRVHDDEFQAIQICLAARGFHRAKPDEILEVVLDWRNKDLIWCVSGDEEFLRTDIKTFTELKKAIVEFYKGEWE